MNIIIFGAANGGYNLYKNLVGVNVVAFSDNDSSRWGDTIDDIPVIEPLKIKKMDFDCLYIGSVHGKAIKDQLVEEMGIPEKKIFDQYHGELFDGRVACLRTCAEEIYRKNIQGSVAELGVYKGDFAKHINRCFPDRKLYLFDTFEGFDSNDVNADKVFLKEQAVEQGFQMDPFKNTSINLVLSKMGNVRNCIVKKGRFPDSLNGLEETFCFVNLDADLYLPTLAGLKYFYPRISKGGFILIHDYDGFLYPGAKKATQEYCDNNNISIFHLNDRGGTVAIIKQ